MSTSLTDDAAPLHVIFGAGPAGLAVADALLARGGRRVRLVSRSGRAAAPAGVEVVAGDAADPAFPRQACTGAAAVYQCLNAPYHRWPELFPPLQAGVLAGAAAAGAKLVVLENLYMYGPTGGRPLTEDLPYAATGKKGTTRARMAEDLLAAHQAGTVRVAIGRASDFFGPRVLASAMGERIFYPALAGRPAQVLGDPDQPHSYSYVPDVAEGLVTLGERDDALGHAWHLPVDETLTTRTFVERVYAEAGRPFRLQRVSRPLVYLLGFFSPTVRELRETLYQFEQPFILDCSRFQRTFGPRATPLDEAIRQTLAWFRSHPRGRAAPTTTAAPTRA